MTDRAQIKERCKTQFTAAVKQIQDETRSNSNEYILIIDHNTKGMISSLFGMTQILNMGVLVLEKLELQRKSFPNANAIYYISPSEESMSRLFEDFKDEKDRKYLSISLLFSGLVSKQLMTGISQNQKVVRRLAAFREYHSDLSFIADHVMSLQVPPTISLAQNSIQRIAQNLFVACTSFPNFYAFDLHYPQQSKYGQMLSLKLSELLKTAPVQASPDSELISVVLTDRRIDPVSPLMRNMCYEPLLRDLFKANGNKIVLSAPNIKPPQIKLLESTDTVFSRYRYKHLSQVINEIKKDFKSEMQNSQAAKFSKNESNNLTATIKELPHFNRLKNFYNLNFDLVGKMNDMISKRNLIKLTELELGLASGFNSEGDDQSDKVLLSNCLEQINSKNIDEVDKNRLIALCLMCVDMKVNDRQNFINQIKSTWPNFEKGLSYLCPKKFRLKDKKRNKKEEDVLIANRHCPVLCEVVSSIIAKKQQPGFRAIKINNIQDKQTQKKHKLGEVKKVQKEKIIVYVAGGIGYDEIAEIERNCSTASIYYCSSYILTPSQYLEQIEKFG